MVPLSVRVAYNGARFDPVVSEREFAVVEDDEPSGAA